MRFRRWAAVPGALAAAALTLAACVAAKVELPAAPVAAGTRIAIQAAPVPLDPGDPAKMSIGAFRYAGGVVLTSNETSQFHGLSDLNVVPASGGHLLFAITDDGHYLMARVGIDASGRLTGFASAALRPLRGLDDQPLRGKEWGDAEGLAVTADGGLLVSFEQHHRIWEYPQDDEGPPTPAPMPQVAMGGNDGMEGLAGYGDTYWVGVEPGSIWFCQRKAACQEVAGLPKPPAGYRLSGLAQGPGRELVILHHSYVPAVGSRIAVTIVTDPLGAKRVIGQFAMGPNTTTDNFEGVAVVPKANGDWRLYLLSDDNFSPSQRTLLLAFDWTPPQ